MPQIAIAPLENGLNLHQPGCCNATGVRVAMFSGNYNYVRDGANNALNRLAGYLLDEGAALRVYSPTASRPAFAPVGDLVSVPSVAFPGRPDYRLALGLNRTIRRDIEAFAPTIFHLSAPDILGRRAQRFARELGVPLLASLHTRFETYFDYYGLGFVRRSVERYLKRFYSDCDLVLVPSGCAAELLDDWGLGNRIRIWNRGVDHTLFSPSRRDMEWRRAQGFSDDEAVLLFFGRLVVEKGTETFAKVVAQLRMRGLKVRPLVVGDGPAHASFAAQLGQSVFLGHIEGANLARAVASADILLNPSVTEAFGNVNLEAMASGVAVVSADVPSARALITHSQDGLLVPADDIAAFADALDMLVRNDLMRHTLGRAAKVRAEHFEWPTILPAVLQAYRELGGLTDIPAAIAAE